MKMVCRTSSRLKTRRDNDLPLETSISASRQTLQDLKPPLEDRGSIIDPFRARLGQKVQSISVNMDEKRCNSVNIVKNIITLEESLKYDHSSVENIVSEGDSSFTSSDLRYNISSNDDLNFRLSHSSDESDHVKCKVIGDSRSVVMASAGLFWRMPLAVLLMVFTAIALESVAGHTGVSARSAGNTAFRNKTGMEIFNEPIRVLGEQPRYETAYACEGKTLKIGCSDGAVIHLIRANYGRFSITICNDHGNTDWSVNCMSTRSLRVLHTRCSMNQNCSILASTNMFGDPCPNTLKYLEAHYQCIPAASTTSTTYRPSPPWLMTSQPSVWRSTTPAAPPAPADAQPPKRRPSVITPPTFRPHITMPPELKPGDVAKVKTTSRQPENHDNEKLETDSSKETKDPKHPSSSDKGANMDAEIGETQKGEKQQKTNIDEKGDELPEDSHWPVDDEPTPPSDSERNADKQEEDHRYGDGGVGGGANHHGEAPGMGMGAPYCRPAHARQLHWNWTMAGSLAVQPCPGGATGLARWRCTLVPPYPRPAAEEQTVAGARRRGVGGGGGLQSGENFADLGLDQAVSTQRQSQQLMRRLSGDSLLIGRDTEPPPDRQDFQDSSVLMLPDAQASSSMDSVSITNGYGDAVAIWMPETPDLSECRSVWLNSLEARVREGESLLSISNDLAQVTSSKTLYGGDMMTTTNIMKRLAQRMSLNVLTFPDNRQREAIVTDMLLGVVKTGSNLLEESQRASWQDLSHAAQMRAATAMLIALEENAFLLAEALLREKTILQQVKNILLSVRVLETRNVEDEVFPSAVAREQWIATEDVITLPRGALIGNSEGGLVRIVFVAFDRLEEILQPLPSESLPRSQGSVSGTDAGSMQTSSLNSEKGDRMNVTRVLNSKIISASLGKGRHIQLSEMVKLTLKHIRTENVSNPTCVFWDYTVNVWSSEGCHVEWWNASHSGCSCAHLTNFAVLMDLHDTRLAPAHALALRLVTLVGCLISSVALLAAVVVFQCFRNMKSERVTIHKNLCLCLLIAEVVFMCGIDQTQNRLVCGLIAAVLHYFFLAAFAWMFLEGFHLYAMLVEVFEPERARSRWYCVAAYLAPACVVGASAAADYEGYGTPRHCWLSAERMFIMSFVGPVAVVLMANWVCLSMVIYMMCHHSNVSVKSKENTKLYKIRVYLKSSVVLAFLLGLTWTFGLLYLNEQTVAVAYVFTALNSLQGLFIFVFHCLQNEMFQKECARLARRHRWLACCLSLAGSSGAASGGTGGSAGSGVPNNNAATASTSNHAPPDHPHDAAGLRHGSMKSRRYHQSSTLEDDSLDARDGVTSANSSISASATNNLVINNLNVVVNNNNHNNNNVINNAAVASLAAAAAAHSYHTHRNRRNSQHGTPENHQTAPGTYFGPNLNATGATFGAGMNDLGSNSNQPQGQNMSSAAPMSHLRNPLNSGSGRYPPNYRQNLQQETVEQSYKLQADDTMSRTNWHVRPSAPIYNPGDDPINRNASPISTNHHPTRTPTPQNVVNNMPNSVSHTQSIASMHSFQGNSRMHHLEADFENRSVRSRSPQSCYSNGKMACSGDGGWGTGGMNGNSNAWKQNTSSKHYLQGGTSTLPHHDSGCHSGTRQLSQHSPYGEAPPSPHHSIKESEDSPLHHHGYHGSSRGLYPHASEYGTGRNPHVYMSQHSPGSQEMIFRKHCKEEGTGRRAKHRDLGHHHYRQGDGVNHTYTEIGSQPGRMYRRDSEQEFRVIHDDPVYEEIERNETLMSDMSDDNSGPDGLRRPGIEGHHGSGRFYADHRPLISYSPGERHERERGSPIDHYGKYNPVNAKWDTLERQGFERYEGGRLMQHPAYHQPQENNMRALAAVLNGENNVVCHLEPHRGNQTNYDVYQPQSGNSRTVSQPSF